MNSTTRQRRDDDHEKSPWRISGKLLAASLIIVALGAIVAVWSFLGGDAGADRAEIHGEVTIDGTPVEIGSIEFHPLDARTSGIAVAAEKIENGKYHIPREVGPNVGMWKIVIRAPKKTGRQFPKLMGAPGELEDEIVEGAAERFNVKSDLQFDVKAGPNTANFEVSAR